MTTCIFKFAIGDDVVFGMEGWIRQRQSGRDDNKALLDEPRYLIRWYPDSTKLPREDWITESELQDFASAEAAGS